MGVVDRNCHVVERGGDLTRLRYVLRTAPSVDAKFKRDPRTEVSFAPMDALMDGLGGLQALDRKPFNELMSGSYNYFEDGDVLLAKVTPCFENGKKAIARSLQNGAGFATSEVFVFRPDVEKIDARFLNYLFSSEDFRHIAIASMTGAGGLRRVSEKAILNFPLRTSSLATQRQIADFLDRETARIDLLIEKKQRLVALLGERLRLSAAHLTTKGLRPTGFATTRIEWNPEAPAYWKSLRMASVFQESLELGGGDLPVLSVSINWGISDRELGDEDRHRIVNHIEDRNAYKRVRAGDLVYNMMRAWQGAFGVAKVDGLVSPAYVVARPTIALHAPFFEYLLRTPMCIEEFRRASKGIADFRQRLYWEHFRQVEIAMPPFDEQVEIANRLDAEAARNTPIIVTTEESIARLREYRSALITAAVTGQIDAEAYAKSGTADRRLDAIEEEMGV